MSTLSRLRKLEAKLIRTASEDPRWHGDLPLFVLYRGEELVQNPLPNLEPLVIRCSRQRKGSLPLRYQAYVVVS